MIARKGTEIPHEEVTSTMASGKRIRAILWKYNYSTLYFSTFVRCTLVLSYVVRKYFRKYEGTKVRTGNNNTKYESTTILFSR
jgi:hypothetical protein